MNINAFDIKRRLDDIADRVEPNDANAAERLRDLGAAVDGGPTADAWASSDIFKLIDPNEIGEQIRSQGAKDRRVARLELARNTTIFLPILVTWVGISLAVDRYYKLLSANPGVATKPFLFLWQDGFGGNLAWLTLSRLGQINGLLLFAVLLLSVASLFLADRVNTKKERDAEQLRSDLNQVLAEASLAFKVRQSQQPTGFINTFDSLGRQILAMIEAERQRISDMANERQKELGNLSVFAADLKQGAQALLSTAQASEQSYREIAAGINALAGPAQLLSTQMKDLLAAAQNAAQPLNQIATQQLAVGTQIRDATSALERSAPDVTAAAKQAVAIADQLTKSQSQFMQSLSDERKAQTGIAQVVSRAASTLEAATQSYQLSNQDLAASINMLAPPVQTLSDQTRDLLIAAQAVAQPMNQIVVQQQSLGQHMSDMLNALNYTAENATNAAAHAATIAGKLADSQDEFLHSLGGERDAQKELAQFVSRSAVDLEAALTSIKEVSKTLHAIAVDMTDLASNLPPRP